MTINNRHYKFGHIDENFEMILKTMEKARVSGVGPSEERLHEAMNHLGFKTSPSAGEGKPSWDQIKKDLDEDTSESEDDNQISRLLRD